MKEEDLFKPNDKIQFKPPKLLMRYRWSSVIFSKKMRKLYPETWDNVMALGILIFCICLYFWRMHGFKVLYSSLKPANTKPLITQKIVHEQQLTMEDLNFIYENSDEYELDQNLIRQVEAYRVKNKLRCKPFN